MFALCAPPTDLYPLVWIGLAGLDYACSAAVERPTGATGAKHAWRGWFDGGARGLAFGFGANVVGLRFIPTVIARFTPLPWVAGLVALVLLALAQGLPWALAGIVRNTLVKRGMPAPFAFAIGVYAATFAPAIFPWTPAGLLSPWFQVVQVADVIGERGVTLLLALAAGLLASAARRVTTREDRRFAAIEGGLGVLLPFAMAGWGLFRVDQIQDRREHTLRAPVGALDPMIPAATRWDPAASPSILANLTHLTFQAEAKASLVTVWPESSYPYVLPHGVKREPGGAQTMFPRGVHGPIIAGAITEDPSGDRMNAVLGVLGDGTITTEYDKNHLLWFGEEVPFGDAFPWLRRTFARGVGLVPGDQPRRIDLTRLKAAPLVCFEDVLPEAGREAALLDPNLLVNLTNDAWFEGSQESEMHLRLSVMRAIETRRDLVRAVNGGVTSFVDATGKVRIRYSGPVPSSILADASLLEGSTVYVAIGDWPWVLICLIASVAYWRRASPEPERTRKKARSA